MMKSSLRWRLNGNRTTTDATLLSSVRMYCTIVCVDLYYFDDLNQLEDDAYFRV